MTKSLRGAMFDGNVAGAWANSWYWFAFIALAFIYLPLYFPDGRLPSRRWLPVAVVTGIGALVLVVLGMLSDTLRGQNVDYRIENPIGIEGLVELHEEPDLVHVYPLLPVPEGRRARRAIVAALRG